MTQMNNADGDLPVQRIDNMDFGATEPAHWLTSMHPRLNELVPVQDGHIRNLQTLIFNREADKQMRIRALAQLRLYAIEDSNLEATAVLRQWEECGLVIEP